MCLYTHTCFGGCCGIGKKKQVILKFRPPLVPPVISCSRKHSRICEVVSHPQPCDNSHLIIPCWGVTTSRLNLLFYEEQIVESMQRRWLKQYFYVHNSRENQRFTSYFMKTGIPEVIRHSSKGYRNCCRQCLLGHGSTSQALKAVGGINI